MNLSDVGGKAFHLHRLTTLGVPVPPWWVVPVEHFDRAMDVLSHEIDARLTHLDPSRLDDCRVLSNEIRDLFVNSSNPIPLPDLSSSPLWAVRSSATLEDSASQSYAGQLESFLYVSPCDVASRVRECWASAFSERALQYLLLSKRSPRDLRVAVVVQHMIDSAKSGVLFTANPVDGDRDTMVIVAGYGVGEGIVSDRVETDRIYLDRRATVLDHVVAHKKTQMKRELTPVPFQLQHRPVLSSRECSRLGRTALRIEHELGCAVDIEWAFDAKGRMMITQARPITTLNERILLDDSNIVESFPGVTLRMTWAHVQDVYSIVFRRALDRLGGHFVPPDVSSSLVAMYRGRIYYNLSSWYRMMRFFPLTESYIRVWEEMLGVQDGVKGSASRRAPWWRVVRPLFSLVWHWLTLKSHLQKLEQSIEEARVDFALRPGLRVDEALAMVDRYKARIFTDWDLTLLNDAYAFAFSGMARHCLQRWCGDQDGRLWNGLLCGADGIDSVGPLRSMMDLAEYLRTHGEDDGFEHRIQEHIACYGDRGIEELKLESETFRDNPESLRRLAREYAKTPLTMNHIKMNETILREEAHKRWKTTLRGHPLRRGILWFLLRHAQRSIAYREKFRLHRARAYGIVRSWCRYIGEILVEQGRLDNISDVFYLTPNEIERDDLADLVSERKREWDEYRHETLAHRYLIVGNEAHAIHQAEAQSDGTLKGVPCSSGSVRADVLVVTDPKQLERDASIARGKILVAPMTDPGWVFLMTVAAGLIVEKGSILSHTAIIGRELGIPTIVGVDQATSILKTGDTIVMNGDTGSIHVEKKILFS